VPLGSRCRARRSATQASTCPVADLAARGRVAQDRFERYALIHDIAAAGAVHVPIPPVVNNQLVVGIVERETLRDALDRVDQPALGLRCLVARSRQLLLSPFDFGHVREHAHGAAVLRLTLADLDPATVPLVMQKRPTGVAMPSKSLRDPFLRSCTCIGHNPTLDHGLDQMLELQSWPHEVGQPRIELAIARVAQHHAIIGVEQEEAFRNTSERIGQPSLGLCCPVACLRQLFRAQFQRALEHRPIAVEIGVCGIDGCYERLQRSRYFVLGTEVLSELAS
jgi:hypothetical protein